MVTLGTNLTRHFSVLLRVQRRTNREGTEPLKHNGPLVSDPNGKADILNRKYQFVFIRENSSNIPDPVESPSPEMPEIEFSRHGTLKLLQDLKENKASDPDLIQPRIISVSYRLCVMLSSLSQLIWFSILSNDMHIITFFYIWACRWKCWSCTLLILSLYLIRVLQDR